MAEFGGQVWNFLAGVFYLASSVQCLRVAIELLSTGGGVREEGSVRRVEDGLFFGGLSAFLGLDSYVWLVMFKRAEEVIYLEWLWVPDIASWVTAFVGIELLRHGFRERDPIRARRLQGIGAWLLGIYCAACLVYWLILLLSTPTPGVLIRYREVVQPVIQSIGWSLAVIGGYFTATLLLWVVVALWIGPKRRPSKQRWILGMGVYMLISAVGYIAFLSSLALFRLCIALVCLCWIVSLWQCMDRQWPTNRRRKVQAAQAASAP